MLTEETMMEECSNTAIDREKSHFELLLAVHVDLEILPEVKHLKTDNTSITPIPGNISVSTLLASNIMMASS